MRVASLWLPLVASIVVFAACTGSFYDDAQVKGGTTASGTGSGGKSDPTGLPCDVATVLAKNCTSCHGSSPVGGAPMALVTYEDLAAASPKGGTYASRSVVRMKDAAAPMPPGAMPTVAAADVDAFSAWVNSGMPKGSCGGGGGSSSSTTGAGGSAPLTGLPCDVASVFSDCVGCHAAKPVGGAPMSLVSYADIAAPSPKGGTYATRSLARMKDMGAPMPPAPAALESAAHIATLSDWILNGMPMGACGGAGGAGAGGSMGAGGAPPLTGIPCDVVSVLGDCVGCHTSPPVGGAPMPLLSYADLAAASPKGGTYADRALLRMEDAVAPMPPAPAPLETPANIATFQTWITHGLPMGACGGGGGSAASSSASTGAGGAPPQTGIPCDVATVLGDCIGCHTSPPVAGAPMPLLSYADLTAASPKGGTYADRSLARIQSAASPMPPSPAPMESPANVTTIQNWITNGFPMGACGGGGGSAASSSASTGAGGAPPQTGLPCDVATILGDCIGCHMSPPVGGAPMPLLSYADLAAASPKGGTYADRSLARMQDALAPMPPSPAAAESAANIAAFQAWVSGGLPMGNCGGVDGGAPNPYDTPDVCTSNIYWAGGEGDWGNYPKSAMHPGDKCIDCHTHPGNYGLPDTGPSLWFGGTVYPTAHEFDECFGINGQQAATTVEITDANNHVVTAKVGVSGDFYLRKGANVPALAYPIQAKVIAGGKTRAMSQAVATGDCNSCHTLKGTGNAPGRIMAP